VDSSPTLETVTAQLAQLQHQLEELTRVVAQHQPLVDLQTAADHMGVSTRTLRRMVHAEQVAYRRVGRSLRFNLSLLSAQRRHLG
jgi:excisionase family DNA binding protein